MPDENSPLRKTSAEPYFWQNAAGYVLIVSGFIIWLGGLIAGGDSGDFSVGLVGMLMGLWLLATLQNRRLKERLDELEKQIHGVSTGREPIG